MYKELILFSVFLHYQNHCVGFHLVYVAHFFFILQLTMHSSSICEVTLYPFFQKKLHKIIVTCLIYEYFFFKIQDMCSVVLFHRNPTQTTMFVTLLIECFSELGNYIEESCDRIVEIWLGDGNAFWIIVKHH